MGAALGFQSERKGTIWQPLRVNQFRRLRRGGNTGVGLRLGSSADAVGFFLRRVSQHLRRRVPGKITL